MQTRKILLALVVGLALSATAVMAQLSPQAGQQLTISSNNGTANLNFAEGTLFVDRDGDDWTFGPSAILPVGTAPDSVSDLLLANAVVPLAQRFTPPTTAILFEVSNGTDSGWVLAWGYETGKNSPEIGIKMMAVPEPETYAAFGMLSLFGLIAARRLRNRRRS